VASSLRDIFASADADQVAGMMSKIALDSMLREGVPRARQSLHQQVVAIVRAYHAFRQKRKAAREQRKALMAAGHNLPPEQLALEQEDDEDDELCTDTPLGLRENLQILPLYALAMQKSPLFRGGTDVVPDLRSSLVYRSLCMPTYMAMTFFYPRMFALHNMPKECGTVMTEEQLAALEMEQAKAEAEGREVEEPNLVGYSNVRIPAPVSLSSSQLDSSGVYIIEDSTELFVWFGSNCPASLMKDILGIESLKGIDTGSAPFPVVDTDLSRRIHTIIGGLIDTYAQEPSVRVVYQSAEDDLEKRFQWRLVEDQQNFRGGSMAY